MAKARITYWYVQAFWKKYRKIIAVSIILGVLLVWFFPRLIQLLPSQRRVKYIGRVGMYTWYDLPRDIQTKISAGLTALDIDGQPVPVLASRWSVEEDGRAFRFLIKDDLRWQDGKKLEVADIEYNFTDVQVVRTENSILFRLQDAYAPFPTVVSQPLFRQKSYRKLGIFPYNEVIGLGEYRVLRLKYKSGYLSELVLENDEERLVYRFYPSQAEAVTAFRMGEVNELEKMFSLTGFTPEEEKYFQVEEGVSLDRFVAVYFNTADPNLTKEMRQALNLATKKPGPSDPLLRALSPVPPTSWAYNSTEEIPTFSYDLGRAVELLQTVDPQQPLEITLDTSIAFLDEAQQIAQQWRELGQQAEQECEADDGLVNAEDSEDQSSSCERFRIIVQVRALRDLNDFQAALVARESPADPDQYSWWHSTQATNITNYQNPRVDKLLEDARKETNFQKRKIMYFEFQKYLVEDVPAMFLYHLPEYRLLRPNIL